MMKKLVLTTAFISTILIIVGCKKNESSENMAMDKWSLYNMPYTFLFEDDTIPTHGLISFSSTRNGFNNTPGLTALYNFNGDFFNQENKLSSDRIEVGELSNGLFTINSDVTNDLNYTYNSSQKNSNTNFSLFGSTLILSATGSSTFNMPSFADTLYNPHELVVTGTFVGGAHNIHSKLDPIQINWNSDNSNPNDKIYIALQYVEGPSKRMDPNNPSNVPLKYFIIDDSNGSFTISSTELSNFPSNCVLSLHLFRGNGVVKKVNNLNFDILVYSHVHQEFDLLP